MAARKDEEEGPEERLSDDYGYLYLSDKRIRKVVKEELAARFDKPELSPLQMAMRVGMPAGEISDPDGLKRQDEYNRVESKRLDTMIKEILYGRTFSVAEWRAACRFLGLSPTAGSTGLMDLVDAAQTKGFRMGLEAGRRAG